MWCHCAGPFWFTVKHLNIDSLASEATLSVDFWHESLSLEFPSNLFSKFRVCTSFSSNVGSTSGENYFHVLLKLLFSFRATFTAAVGMFHHQLRRLKACTLTPLCNPCLWLNSVHLFRDIHERLCRSRSFFCLRCATKGKQTLTAYSDLWKYSHFRKVESLGFSSFYYITKRENKKVAIFYWNCKNVLIVFLLVCLNEFYLYERFHTIFHCIINCEVGKKNYM